TMHQVLSDDPAPPRRLVKKLPRDLETIALKCLRKEPEKRYGSAEALADDLRRWLDGRPIAARPGRAREEAWKGARREKGKALAAGLFVCLLAGGTAWATHAYQARVRAAQEREEQERHALAEARGHLELGRGAFAAGRLEDARAEFAVAETVLKE